MAHLGLRLEDGAHQVRETLVERQDLLELVEDHHDAPLPLGRQLPEQLEQTLDRLVDVLAPAPRLEAEPQAPVRRIDLHRRLHAEAAEEVDGTFEGVLDR